MIELQNETPHPISSDLFEAILAHKSQGDIECTIVDTEAMRSINHATRHMDKATDVLSFPLESVPGNTMLGTIVICYDVARQHAEDFGHSVETELQLLFIHGLLHLLGYDHETDDGEMRQQESDIIKHFDLPESLIVRNEER